MNGDDILRRLAEVPDDYLAGQAGLLYRFADSTVVVGPGGHLDGYVVLFPSGMVVAWSSDTEPELVDGDWSAQYERLAQHLANRNRLRSHQ